MQNIYRASLLAELDSLLESVDRANAAAGHGNPCASCFSCCTARGLSRHRVTELEYDLMGERVSRQAAVEFRRYIDRESKADGSYVHEVCPNYDMERRGCGVYAHRPFACRVFGHRKPAGTPSLPGCYYSGREEEFQDYFREIPGARELRRLVREHCVLQAPEAAHYAAPAQEIGQQTHLDPEDPLDRVTALQLEGRAEDALALMVQLYQADPSSLYAHYRLALLLSFLEQHEAALAVYSALLERLPERSDWHYYVGFHALFAGKRELAWAHFEETVQALPEHSLALGFLGYMSLQEERLSDAQFWFQRALSADPENPILHKRLAAVREALDMRPTCEAPKTLEANAPAHHRRHRLQPQAVPCGQALRAG